MRHHLEVQGAGHYGIFSGRRWREQVYPQVRDFIAAHDAPQTRPTRRGGVSAEDTIHAPARAGKPAATPRAVASKAPAAARKRAARRPSAAPVAAPGRGKRPRA
jgi:poly(3-hydroxybutyrate) depolymerase